MDIKNGLTIKEINDFLNSHNCKVDGRTIHLSVLCDSTAWFLVRMVQFLQHLGCTDIKTNGYVENDGLYGYRFEVSGILPEGIEIEQIESEVK